MWLLRTLCMIHPVGKMLCYISYSKVSIRKVQLSDFGSAKQLDSTQLNVTFITSRYYRQVIEWYELQLMTTTLRAPELLMGSLDYTCAIVPTLLYSTLLYSMRDEIHKCLGCMVCRMHTVWDGIWTTSIQDKLLLSNPSLTYYTEKILQINCCISLASWVLQLVTSCMALMTKLHSWSGLNAVCSLLTDFSNLPKIQPIKLSDSLPTTMTDLGNLLDKIFCYNGVGQRISMKNILKHSFLQQRFKKTKNNLANNRFWLEITYVQE
jgi:serine/threonine protein kinase